MTNITLPKSPYERPCILASLPISDSYPRDIFRGLMKYAHDSQRFAIRFHDQERHNLEDLRKFALDKAAVGFVVFGHNPEIIQLIKELGLPAVNVSNTLSETGLPSVLVDNDEVGMVAADHLVKKGYTNHVFIHLEGQDFSYKRRMGWRRRLKSAGMNTHVITYSSFEQTMGILETLPLPLAITTATDHLGRSILDRCLNVGWSVPEDVAVLGCSNNELVCEGGLLTLSSVPIQGITVGVTASKVLIDMIDNCPPPDDLVLIRPGSVIERESTDLIQNAEPSISTAIRYIRSHACTGIQIADVLKTTGLSRATLDRQVKRVLGHSPHAEIKRIQIERARHLLANTHFPLAEISKQCGYKEPNYFMRVFREEVGQTPTEYRRDILAKADDMT